MKNYTITVNGNVYDVTVEENGAGAVQTAAPVVAPKAVAPAAPKAAPAAGAGSIQVKAGACCLPLLAVYCGVAKGKAHAGAGASGCTGCRAAGLGTQLYGTGRLWL